MVERGVEASEMLVQFQLATPNKKHPFYGVFFAERELEKAAGRLAF